MSTKPVRYDPHAVDDMRLRGFTRQDVRWLLAHGVRTEERTDAGRQRYGVRAYLRQGWQALAVFLEFPDHIYVISVQWVARPVRRKRKER